MFARVLAADIHMMKHGKLVAAQKKLEWVARAEKFLFPQLISADAASSKGTYWHLLAPNN